MASTTTNLGLKLLGTSLQDKDMYFSEWRQTLNGEVDDSNMNIIDDAYGEMAEDIQEINGDIQGINQDIQGITQDVQDVTQDVHGLTEDVQDINTEIQGIKDGTISNATIDYMVAHMFDPPAEEYEPEDEETGE